MSVAIAHTAYGRPRRVAQRELRRQVGVRAVRVLDRLLDLERHLLAHHPQVVGPHRARQLGREQLLVAAARGALAVDAEQQLEAAVDERVAALGVLDVDHRRRVVDDRLHPLAALAQRRLGALARGHVLHLDDQVERPLLGVAHERDRHERDDRLAVRAPQALLDLVARHLAGQHPRHVARVGVVLVGRDRRSVTSTPTSSSGDVPISSHSARFTRRKQPARSCSMLTRAMPIGACSNAPRKRSSASCTMVSARARSVTSRSTAVVNGLALPRSSARTRPRAGSRRPSARRQVADSAGAVAVLELRRPLAQQLRPGAGPTSSAPGRPEDALRGRVHVGDAAVRRRRTRSRPRRSRRPRGSAPRSGAAPPRPACARSACRPGPRPRTRAPPGARPPRAPRARRTPSPPRPLRRARTGTATPAASPTACANRPRSKPGSERTSRIQTGARDLPGLARQADARARTTAPRSPGGTTTGPARRRARPGCTRACGRQALRTQAWPIAQPVRSHTARSTVRERKLGRVGAGDRQRQLVRRAASSSSARRRSVTSRPTL